MAAMADLEVLDPWDFLETLVGLHRMAHLVPLDPVVTLE